MSVRAMAWVWDHSQAKPTQRLVLLAIADCANDRGTEAYPSNATLVDKTGLSERGVRQAIAELEKLGELEVEYKGGPRGCNRYRVTMAHPARGAESSDTRHEPPGSRRDMPGTRHSVHPAPHADDPAPHADDPAPHADDPAPHAPEPSGTIKNRPEPSEVAPPEQPPEPTRPEVDQLCQHLADRVEANGSKRPTIGKRWRDAARLMLDTDGRTVAQITTAIDWCQDDEFWRANIMSMPKLRQKYDQLRLAAQRNGARALPGSQKSTGDRRVAAALEAGARLQAQLDQQHEQRQEITP